MDSFTFRFPPLSSGFPRRLRYDFVPRIFSVSILSTNASKTCLLKNTNRIGGKIHISFAVAKEKKIFLRHFFFKKNRKKNRKKIVKKQEGEDLVFFFNFFLTRTLIFMFLLKCLQYYNLIILPLYNLII